MMRSAHRQASAPVRRFSLTLLACALAPAAHETERLVNLLRDEGLLTGSEGVLGNIIKMRPPLVFTPDEADIALAALDRALGRL